MTSEPIWAVPVSWQTTAQVPLVAVNGRRLDSEAFGDMMLNCPSFDPGGLSLAPATQLS